MVELFSNLHALPKEPPQETTWATKTNRLPYLKSIIRRMIEWMIEDAVESFWPKLGCCISGNSIANKFRQKTLCLIFVTDFMFGQIGSTFLRHCRFITPFWSRWKEKWGPFFRGDWNCRIDLTWPHSCEATRRLSSLVRPRTASTKVAAWSHHLSWSDLVGERTVQTSVARERRAPARRSKIWKLWVKAVKVTAWDFVLNGKSYLDGRIGVKR